MSALKFLTFEYCILVPILSVLDDLFPHFTRSEFAEISVVISSHFLVENNGFWNFSSWNQNILEKGEAALAELTKFRFN